MVGEGVIGMRMGIHKKSDIFIRDTPDFSQKSFRHSFVGQGIDDNYIVINHYHPYVVEPNPGLLQECENPLCQLREFVHGLYYLDTTPFSLCLGQTQLIEYQSVS